MLRVLAALPGRFYPVLDWFIPERLKAEAETLRRVRMFMVSHLFGPFLGHTISLNLLALDPHPGIAWWGFFGAIAAFWLFPLALRLDLPYVPLALLSVQNLIFTILWGCYHYGGLNSPLQPWVVTIPLLAFFYLGSARTIQIGVLAMILFDLVIFYIFSDGGQVFPEHVPLEALSGLGIISTVCAAAYVSMMALYYASLVNSQVELEREVARRMETAEQLREATRRADRANRAKSDFLAKMSHELRTPLNAIIGYSALLLEDAEASDREQQARDLTKILGAGQHLLSLINDLLELSKLDAGKMDLYVENLSLASLIADTAASAREQIAAGGNTLLVDCPADIGVMEADATKLGSAIGNLLSNGAKFTRNGRIVLAARREAGWLSISVTDTGVGVDQRRLARLFENFAEDEAATPSRYGGTGLGLALSRKLCRLMGGDISVTSDIGKGSCFTIAVPLSRQEAAANGKRDGRIGETAEAAATVGGVLVIDDDPAVLDFVQRILAREGYRSSVAAGGFQGIEMAREMRPVLILLDARMSELSGAQVLKAIRSDKTLMRCPVVMLTGEDGGQQGRTAGAQGYLAKPIDETKLRDLLARLLPDRNSYDQPPPRLRELAAAA
jgi:signal transduction histidine kinase/CheY-like chemotaxis protein